MSKTSRQSIAHSANTSIDFKVDPKTGVGYISQRKAAELCGVSHTAVRKRLHALGFHNKYNENNLLDEKTLVLVSTYYAFDAGHYCTKEAKNTAKALMQAGARAFIYYQAGVQVVTDTPKRDLPPPPTSLPPLPPPPPRSTPAAANLKAAYKEELQLHARTQQELMQAKVRTAQLEYELALAKIESRIKPLTHY